jgi:hypothetical protein
MKVMQMNLQKVQSKYLKKIDNNNYYIMKYCNNKYGR